MPVNLFFIFVTILNLLGPILQQVLAILIAVAILRWWDKRKRR